jgi:glycerophosphoryl diester phosphodiesterase
MKPWPYPFWIAHRGAGRLAPENTLAAFRLGAEHGYRMFECDAKLSADGVPFLLHDSTLQRTSNGRGIAGEQPWSALARLDAGNWHSRRYAGEPLPTLDALIRFCLANRYQLDIEIKPTPGVERRTGEVVAQRVGTLWTATDLAPPLLTSFSTESLEGARSAQPGLLRGLLLDTLWNGWLDAARGLDCAAIVCNYALWDAATMAQVHAAGMRALSYTVNDPSVARWLAGLGIDGIVTDRVDRFGPA